MSPGGTVAHDGVQRVHAAETFQLDVTRRGETEIPRTLGQLSQQCRGEDLASTRLRGDPRGEDHVLAEEVVRLLDDLARVQDLGAADSRIGLVLTGAPAATYTDAAPGRS